MHAFIADMLVSWMDTQKLLGSIQSAKKRIILGSLYFGTEGGPEGEFMDVLSDVARSNPNLEVRTR